MPKIRDTRVGEQHIELYYRGTNADGTERLALVVDGEFVHDMTFDEAVLRACNGEQIIEVLYPF